MPSNLLATKLYLPTIPPRWVHRPRLVQRLNEGLAAGRRLTLVSAPAGFGKTTGVSEWVHSLELPVTWLSLDPADDDPERFFTYLVAALRKVDEKVGREVEAALPSGQLPSAEAIATTLVNDLAEFPGRFVLVLDDFHLLQDRLILQVLETLVINLPPSLHLVLLTREDPSLPLARLRANNQLTEVRAGELRFTTEETDRFLNEVMALGLASADVATLEDRTEGWIVGLQLAGLSIRDRSDPSTFIAGLRGSHRHILAYLTEQVLDRQPEEITLFLLQTSILDKLSGDLCNAVTGRTDGHLVLERLFNANLFLISLDDEQRWYRYHHLFVDLLRDRAKILLPDRIAELHRRAGAWYAQAGMVSEAVQHAAAAKDYATAVQLIEKNATATIVQGYVKTVEGWLEAVPPEFRSQSPRVDLAFAWMHLLRGTFDRLAPYVERLQAYLSASPEQDPSLQAEWLSLQSYLTAAQGQAARGLELANQALKIVPEQDGYVQSLAYNALGIAYQQMGDYAHSVEAYQQAIRHGRAGGNVVAEMLSTSILAQVVIQHGRLHLALEIASQGTERLERLGSLPSILAVTHGALGQVYYQWDQIEPAHDHFQQAIRLCSLGGYNDVEGYYRAGLARLLQRKGEMEAATQEIEQAVELMQVGAHPWAREGVVSQQIRLYLAQDRLAEAEAATQGLGFTCQDKLSELTAGPDSTPPAGSSYNWILRILLHRFLTNPGPGSLQSGIEPAGRLIDQAIQGRWLPIALEALLLRARMQAALGNEPAGLTDCTQALELAEPEGYICLFVEEGATVEKALATLLAQNRLGTIQPGYVQSVLAAFSRFRPPAPDQPAEREPQGLIEPLSKRELEILCLIEAGYSNQEIAERLVLSLHTVKKHSSNVFGKLGVNSRTQAIARARELNLL